MEEDDDDLYDPADSFLPQQGHNNYNQTTEDTKAGGESYDYEEDEEDDVYCNQPFSTHQARLTDI